MSAYAIVSRETAPDVARVLEEKGLADAPLVVAEPGQGPTLLAEAARVPADILLLDIATGPGLGRAVLRYRLARPKTRIALLAFGRQPGDGEVAQVVQAGVYDVTTSLEDLAAALDGPPADFARAAIWLDPSLAPEAEQRPREVVVERRVPISTRPVLIGVVNAAPGAGATTVAAAVAGYLARQGYRTCLVAADGTRDLELISGLKSEKEPRRWVPGLDLWTGDFRDALVLGRYQYVIADLGRPAYQEAAALPADLTLVVLPPPHRIDRVLEWRRDKPYIALPRARYVTLAAPGSKAVAKVGELAELWAHAFYPDRKEASIEFGALPLPPDGVEAVTKPHPGLEAALGEVLAPVLPEGPPKRRRRFLRLGSKTARDTDAWFVWPLIILFAFVAAAMAWPEIRGAWADLARMGAAVKAAIRDPIGALFSLLF